MEKFEQHGKSIEEDLSIKTVLRGLYGLCRELAGRRSVEHLEPTEPRTLPFVCGLVFRNETRPPDEHPEQGQLF